MHFSISDVYVWFQGQEPGQEQGHEAFQPPLQAQGQGHEASPGVPGVPEAPLFSDADDDALNGNRAPSSAVRHPGAVGDPPAAAGILLFSPNF